MNNVYISEMRRAFKTSGFYIAILLGTVIGFLYWWLEVYPLSKQLQQFLSYDYSLKYPFSMFHYWLGMDSTQYAYTYFMCLPLMATLPFASSYFLDKKNGYINFICTRCNKKSYLKAKILATSVSGSVACGIPLAINIMLTMTILPYVKPEAATYETLIQPKSSMSNLYFTEPWLYIILSLAIIVIYASAMACIALTSSTFIKNYWGILFAALIYNLFLMSFAMIIGESQWQPVFFVHPGYPNPRIVPFTVETWIIYLVTILKYYYTNKEMDIC